jgi:hypothetical protein
VHHRFPVEFRAVVRQLVRGCYNTASVLNTLPVDVLELVITHLAREPYSWITTPSPGAAAVTGTKSQEVDRSVWQVVWLVIVLAALGVTIKLYW